MRLRRFKDALNELAEASGAAAIALRLHCSAALGDWAEVAELSEAAHNLQDVDETERAEIAISRAYAAFFRGDASEMRGLLLAMNAQIAPRFVAWQQCLLGWAAALECHYTEQALQLERMVRFIDETPAAFEVVFLANAAQALADLAWEVSSAGTFEFAVELAARVPWTHDLAEQKFLTYRSLAWAHALRGSRRRAQRMMHMLVDSAPSSQWRATIYGELAYLMRIGGATDAADGMLDHATESALATAWETSGEERVGLLSLIELAAEHNAAGSVALLGAYDGISTGLSDGLALAHGRCLHALERHARAAVMVAAGRTREAVALLQEAFSAFKKLGYGWRAALSALRLHALTGDREWLKRAKKSVAHFPGCALAAEIRRRESGSSDPRIASLTSTQRRAFRLVCEGMSDAQIANAMEITINTARNHVAMVRKSFGVHSRSRLVAIARSTGLFA